jgi:hypothetical protein
MSKNRSKKTKATLERREVMWMYRKCKEGLDKAEGQMKRYQGRTDLSELEKFALETAQQGGPFLLEMTRLLEGVLNRGAEERMGMEAKKAELKGVMEFAEEEDVKMKAQEEIASIPEKEGYDFVMDRPMAKFFLDMVEGGLEQIRAHVIPKYESEDPANFPNPLMTKSYYINKAKKTKLMLEGIRSTLEKAL